MAIAAEWVLNPLLVNAENSSGFGRTVFESEQFLHA